jgi:hypothetical protein
MVPDLAGPFKNGSVIMFTSLQRLPGGLRGYCCLFNGAACTGCCLPAGGRGNNSGRVPHAVWAGVMLMGYEPETATSDRQLKLASFKG